MSGETATARKDIRPYVSEEGFGEGGGLAQLLAAHATSQLPRTCRIEL